MEEMNFEQAILELEQVIKQLETGDLSLDDSIEKFKKGVELSNVCNKKLEEAQKSITLLTQDNNGNLVEEDFNL